jgi:hypothetical protein
MMCPVEKMKAAKRVVTMPMPNGFCYLVFAFSNSDRSSLKRATQKTFERLLMTVAGYVDRSMSV